MQGQLPVEVPQGPKVIMPCWSRNPSLVGKLVVLCRCPGPHLSRDQLECAQCCCVVVNWDRWGRRWCQCLLCGQGGALPCGSELSEEVAELQAEFLPLRIPGGLISQCQAVPARDEPARGAQVWPCCAWLRQVCQTLAEWMVQLCRAGWACNAVSQGEEKLQEVACRMWGSSTFPQSTGLFSSPAIAGGLVRQGSTSAAQDYCFATLQPYRSRCNDALAVGLS